MVLKREQAFQPVLAPLHGGGDKKPRSLDRDVITIGRARGCDIGLEAPDVSTIHCILYRATDGYRVRDCGSRTGTRINGESVKLGLITDSDVLQIGPFSFEVRIPGLKGSDLRKYDFRLVEKLVKSRRRLAQRAMHLRQRLHALVTNPGAGPGDLDRKAGDLKAKIKVYDGRLGQLEEAERDLEEDRRLLDQEREAQLVRVQKVEGDLAAMLQAAEVEIHGRWQEFQKRCRTQEEKFDQERRGFSQQKTELELARQAWLTEKENFMHNRIASNGTAVHQDEQHQAFSLAEAALREQRTELAKMIGELKSLQGSIRRQQSGDVQALLEENEQLRDMMGELERRLALQVELAQPTTPAPGVPDAHLEPLLEENQMLRQLLEEKSQAVGELEERLRSAPRPKVPAAVQANDQDLENFEAELNQFRRQLENDRARFDKDCEQFRERKAELDEATKEMEMAMSRERAELARERIRLDRLREEVKNELERMQRDAGVMQSLAPVQRLREQLNQRARQ